MNFQIFYNNFNNFSTIFLSIILEGFPFIIIGALISSLIQVFISEETVTKVIPKNKFLGMLSMALIGFIFPVCECGIIPIARRLIKKGVPVSMAVTFMLAVPIINPVVLMSTYYAFLGNPQIVLVRAIFGVTSALIIGYLIGELYEGNALRNNKINNTYKNITKANSLKNPKKINKNSAVPSANHKIKLADHSSYCDCGHHHDHGDSNGLISEIIGHASSELYDIGRFFIFGALLSGIMQTYIPKNYIYAIGNGKVSSILTMMCLAFLLSICSETDAFIARTFVEQFTKGSIIGFLIFGPMLDLKNTIMLTSSFKLGFVVKLIFIIFAVCFIMAVIANYIPFYSFEIN